MELKISPGEVSARIALLKVANVGRAARVAERVSRSVVEQLNNSDINVADHLLAQALVAHASLATAAAWWADMQKTPVAQAMAALTDICINLPPELDGESIDTRKEAGGG